MTLPRARWTEEVHEKLCEMLKHTGKTAVFDWDNTVIRGDMGMSTLSVLDEKNGTRLQEEYDWLLAQHGVPIAYPFCTTVHAGHSDASLRQLAEQVWMRGIENGSITIIPEMKSLIEAMRAQDWDLWVISASAQQLVETAAAHLGFSSERVLAMRLASDSQRTLLPILHPPATFSTGKADAARHAIKEPLFFAAGDSLSDGPMLDLARYALVNSGEEQGLQAMAKERGWWVQAGL